MKITVLGGSGMIGSKLVKLLEQRGHEVVAASPNTGVNTFTGERLDEALAGSEVVVDVTNSPSFEDHAVLEFFETSGRNIVAAEIKAGVQHHILLSIVGTERLTESGYFRGKLAQERIVKQSPIPYTILRSTQYFEFLGSLAQAATDGEVVRLSPVHFQPIAADDIAEALAKVAEGSPHFATVEVAGPERVSLAELVQRFLEKTGDSRHVVADPNARYYGAQLDEQSLTPSPHARLSTRNFDEWFRTLYELRPQMVTAGQ